MLKVVMQTVEPVSTIEATVRLVKPLDSTYSNSYLRQVANNATQLGYEGRNQLLTIIEDFEDLFDGTLGYCDTETVKL